MIRTRLCDLLGIEYPMVQAPMNWITGADLAAAVSNAGGLGMLALASRSIVPGMLFHLANNTLAISADGKWLRDHVPWSLRDVHGNVPLYQWPVLAVAAILAAVGIWWAIRQMRGARHDHATTTADAWLTTDTTVDEA